MYTESCRTEARIETHSAAAKLKFARVESEDGYEYLFSARSVSKYANFQL